MSTMAENVIAAGADNRPPMLERSQPFLFETVNIPTTPTTPASTHVKTMDDLTDEEKIREAADIRAANIVLQGLPPDVYTLVNQHIVAKEIWDKVKLLIKEKEETIHRFVTDVKLAKDMHNSSFDKLYAYLKQHKVHANKVCVMSQRFLDPLALQPQFYIPLLQPQSYEAPVYQQLYFAPLVHQAPVVHQQSYQAPVVHQQSPIVFPQLDSGLAVPSCLPTNDLITSLNKSMAFISTEFASLYPPTNNQLRTLSNPRTKPLFKTIGSQNVPKNSEWFKEKILLAQDQESRVILDEEYLTFFTYPWGRVDSGLYTLILPTIAIFQSDDLDAFDLDYDEAPSASAVLMAKLSAYDLDILSEIPNYDTY
ncbi:hypothetical protein Tco_1056741 [Tanacetum coccineum]|uniref:Integrase, catalytic region, zinc finger, CCHC-type, peptidase aspartic, catalytic n=1 Tax=Tanacetum coccineum TaxID=301880 RepID=A0ABQ5H462_9ASTR